MYYILYVYKNICIYGNLYVCMHVCVCVYVCMYFIFIYTYTKESLINID